MTISVARSQGHNVHPLWLMPSVMTFVAFYENLFSFGGLVAQFCSLWLEYSRRVWDSLAHFLPAGYIYGDSATYDLLTLWLTASLVVWLFPKLTPQSDGRIKTTVAALQELVRLPPLGARAFGFIAIAVSISVLSIPFGVFSPTSGSLASALQQSQLISGSGFAGWLSGPGLWFSILLVALGAAALTYVFFWIGPRLELAELSPEEKRDLLVIAAVLWTVSAGFLVLALVAAPNVFFLGFGKQDAMALSLLALVGLIAWRSALPLVQLATLICAAIVLNEVFSFFYGVWITTPGA